MARCFVYFSFFFILFTVFFLPLVTSAEIHINTCQALEPGNTYILDSNITIPNDPASNTEVCFYLDTSNSSEDINFDLNKHFIFASDYYQIFFDFNNDVRNVNIYNGTLDFNDHGNTFFYVSADINDFVVSDLNFMNSGDILYVDIFFMYLGLMI